MPKKVYLVRHGESEHGAQKLHQLDDVALSERGMRQSRDVANRFTHLAIHKIYSSPHRRTLQTAEHIVAVTGAPIKTTALLQERRQPSEIVGKLRTDPEVVRIKKLMAERRNDPSWRYSDEESIFELRDRVKKFQDSLEHEEQENIVIVSHALFIKMFTLLGVFGDLVTPDLFASYYLHVRTSQTGITMFDRTEHGWRLLTWNDYAHLGDDSAEGFHK